MQRWRQILPASIGLGLALCGLVVGQPASPATQPTTQPTTQPIAPVDDPLKSPITFFNKKCSDCHGKYGNYWHIGFVREYDRTSLRVMVDEMARDTAFAPLDDVPLDVQTDYVATIVDGSPFASAWFDGGVWRGEVTPNATVALGTSAGDASAASFELLATVTVEGHTWFAEAGPDVTALRLTLDEQTVDLQLDAARVVWTTSKLPRSDDDAAKDQTNDQASDDNSNFDDLFGFDDFGN
ncbi:MAG: hypothetical protein AAGK78_05205 [Planctomycetota bacterium]